MKYYNILIGTTVVLLSVVCVQPSNAEIITVQADILMSGAAPDLPSHWLTAIFDDHNSSGLVTLTLTTHLTGGEFIGELDFNLDPSLDPKALIFDELNAHKGGVFSDPDISTGVNANKADGGGYCDITFSFSHGSSASRFGDNESYTIDISGISLLTTKSFMFTSVGGGDKGDYLMIGHVQGIATSDPNTTTSGWVAVPEPSAWILLTLGLLGMTISRRWRRN